METKTGGTGFLIRHTCKQQHSPCACRANYWADRLIELAEDNVPAILLAKEEAYAEAIDWTDSTDLIVWDFADGSTLNVFATATSTPWLSSKSIASH
jgi:hypothetical protein